MGSSEFSFTQDGPRMAILHLIVLAFGAAITSAEAEAEADAQVHHGGTYGYTPVPAPVYGPGPGYHVSPLSIPFHLLCLLSNQHHTGGSSLRGSSHPFHLPRGCPSCPFCSSCAPRCLCFHSTPCHP